MFSFFKIFKFSLYNLYILYIYFGFKAYIIKSIFYRVCIVRVFTRLMANIIWNFGVRPYALRFRNLVHIFQGLKFIL